MKTELKFSELSGPKIRLDLLKYWKKAKPDTLIIRCDHQGFIKEWDCGCSWGCAQCNLKFHCTDCGGRFAGANIPAVWVK